MHISTGSNVSKCLQFPLQQSSSFSQGIFEKSGMQPFLAETESYEVDT